MAKELTPKETELLEQILEFVQNESITLDGFNAIAQAVKKEYGRCVL